MNNDVTLIQQQIINASIQMGLSDAIAADLSQLVIGQIQQQCQGDVLYIPKSGKNERNRRIIRMFNGTNHADVCAAFNISRRTLYRVLGG